MASYTETLEKSWNDLDDSEQEFVKQHPAAAYHFRVAALAARKEAENRFRVGELHNGPGDAFRHCYWNARMVKAAGVKLAEEFATAHERRPGQPRRELEMDLFNNERGRWLGYLYQDNPDAFIANKCMEWLVLGKLGFF